MPRTSYPIVRKLLIVLILTAASQVDLLAQAAGNVQRGPSTTGANPPVFLLFCFFTATIILSILYRKFMLNRLLVQTETINKTLVADDRRSKENSHIEQLLAMNEPEPQARYLQLVKNLEYTLELLQSGGHFFGEEDIRVSLQKNIQKIFTLTTVHDRFYYRDDQKWVDVNELVPLLIENLSLSDGTQARFQFVYSSTSRSIELELTPALALAKIINEILFWFAAAKSLNYVSEAVGFYLQETKGHVKLTVRAEGLSGPKDLRPLRRNLLQCMHAHFPESMEPQLQIDQSLGTSINFQMQKRHARVSQVL